MSDDEKATHFLVPREPSNEILSEIAAAYIAGATDRIAGNPQRAVPAARQAWRGIVEAHAALHPLEQGAERVAGFSSGLCWRDISTIPNAEYCVLVWDQAVSRSCIMRADDWHAKPKPSFVNRLTHWMPLPAPPTDTEKNQSQSAHSKDQEHRRREGEGNG